MSEELDENRQASLEQQDLRRRLGTALDVEQFKASPVGKYLVQRCDEERDTAYQDLAKVDPEDASAVREAQNRVHMANTFFTWLLEATHDGQEALRVMESRETD